jgi:hypothetical protein
MALTIVSTIPIPGNQPSTQERILIDKLFAKVPLTSDEKTRLQWVARTPPFKRCYDFVQSRIRLCRENVMLIDTTKDGVVDLTTLKIKGLSVILIDGIKLVKLDLSKTTTISFHDSGNDVRLEDKRTNGTVVSWTINTTLKATIRSREFFVARPTEGVYFHTITPEMIDRLPTTALRPKDEATIA